MGLGGVFFGLVRYFCFEGRHYGTGVGVGVGAGLYFIKTNWGNGFAEDDELIIWLMKRGFFLEFIKLF